MAGRRGSLPPDSDRILRARRFHTRIRHVYFIKPFERQSLLVISAAFYIFRIYTEAKFSGKRRIAVAQPISNEAFSSVITKLDYLFAQIAGNVLG